MDVVVAVLIFPHIGQRRGSAVHVQTGLAEVKNRIRVHLLHRPVQTERNQHAPGPGLAYAKHSFAVIDIDESIRRIGQLGQIQRLEMAGRAIYLHDGPGLFNEPFDISYFLVRNCRV